MGRRFLRGYSGIDRAERSFVQAMLFDSIFVISFSDLSSQRPWISPRSPVQLNFLGPLPLLGTPGLPAPWAALGGPCCCCCWPAAGGYCCGWVSPPAGGF